MKVTLIDYARDPLTKLYGAYRTCYTQKSPSEVWAEIGEGKTSPEVIRVFVKERLATGHVSPLEQVVFWFGIEGVSRALSHQFVRHRIGISFEQQSQRYVRYKPGKLDFLTPDSWSKDPEALARYEECMRVIAETYQFGLDRGIPAEDARFVLPNATPTNFQVMVNLAELLHICDLRLCHRAQWEIRYMVGLFRAEVRKAVPELAAVMQPKCGEARAGYCDEDEKAYLACPLSKARPHKKHLLELWSKRSIQWQQAYPATGEALTEADIQPPEKA
jgi:thymidylate synthase (FAD)